MQELNLQYRLAQDHIGRGLISSSVLQLDYVSTHTENPFWSYVRCFPVEWNAAKIEDMADKRTEVIDRLLDNLDRLKNGEEIELSPLKDDQRVSGYVYSENPLQNMFNIIQEYAKRYREPFYGKWGGYQPEKVGKRFMFYVENEQEAYTMVERINNVAGDLCIPLFARQQYGVKDYGDFVEVNCRLKSKVKNKNKFMKFLEEMEGYNDFLHELFVL
ncbi:hypothetical protein J4434_07305 [Candidatus Woesearchaeota archaeon]|nr:hypothetical protein [Candidatus Woesearchaeota archaeon]